MEVNLQLRRSGQPRSVAGADNQHKDLVSLQTQQDTFAAFPASKIKYPAGDVDGRLDEWMALQMLDVCFKDLSARSQPD